jgi:5-methylcytosine-specific restriction protein A
MARKIKTTAARDKAVGHGLERSPKWPSVQKLHLKLEPECAACGSTKQLQVHHKKPFHLFPELELDLHNLITLCMDEKDCHINIGHGDNFKHYNPDVTEDSAKVRSDQTLFESVAAAAKKKRLLA